ncbi:MAG TPA: CDP-alcohol phosphatidyltransferase family protein, partial [Reyranella sp.]|nr:CDP-alcohol phosphatidyltransferase family protein [Reyranella sp.]
YSYWQTAGNVIRREAAVPSDSFDGEVCRTLGDSIIYSPQVPLVNIHPSARDSNHNTRSVGNRDLDGRVARRLGVTSRFGAELDSLSDFLCFGVSPALVLYLASLKDAGALGWVVTLMFPMCSALRLARFNTALDADTPPPAWTGAYFTGVPAPAGALLALIPLVVSFEIEAAWPSHALVVGAVLVVVGGLMVSRLPTFSFKKGRVPRHLVLPSLLAVALMLGVIASSPWIGMSLLGLGYASLIPFSWLAYRRQATQDRQATAAGDVVALRAVDSGQPPRD